MTTTTHRLLDQVLEGQPTLVHVGYQPRDIAACSSPDVLIDRYDFYIERSDAGWTISTTVSGRGPEMYVVVTPTGDAYLKRRDKWWKTSLSSNGGPGGWIDLSIVIGDQQADALSLLHWLVGRAGLSSTPGTLVGGYPKELFLHQSPDVGPVASGPLDPRPTELRVHADRSGRTCAIETTIFTLDGATDPIEVLSIEPSSPRPVELPSGSVGDLSEGWSRGELPVCRNGDALPPPTGQIGSQSFCPNEKPEFPSEPPLPPSQPMLPLPSPTS